MPRRKRKTVPMRVNGMRRRWLTTGSRSLATHGIAPPGPEFCPWSEHCRSGEHTTDPAKAGKKACELGYKTKCRRITRIRNELIAGYMELPHLKGHSEFLPQVATLVDARMALMYLQRIANLRGFLIVNKGVEKISGVFDVIRGYLNTLVRMERELCLTPRSQLQVETSMKEKGGLGAAALALEDSETGVLDAEYEEVSDTESGDSGLGEAVHGEAEAGESAGEDAAVHS